MNASQEQGPVGKSYRRTDFIYITPNKQKANNTGLGIRNIYEKTMVKEQENYM